MRSDEDTMQFVERPLMQNVLEADSLCANILDLCKHKTVWFWVIELVDTGQSIGTITLWNLNQEMEMAELGFMMVKDFIKNGYMKEASKEVVRFAFLQLKLNSIEAHTRPENLTSVSVLLFLGFSESHFLVQNVKFNGHIWDTVIYTLLRNRHKD